MWTTKKSSSIMASSAIICSLNSRILFPPSFYFILFFFEEKIALLLLDIIDFYYFLCYVLTQEMIYIHWSMGFNFCLLSLWTITLTHLYSFLNKIRSKHEPYGRTTSFPYKPKNQVKIEIFPITQILNSVKNPLLKNHSFLTLHGQANKA